MAEAAGQPMASTSSAAASNSPHQQPIAAQPDGPSTSCAASPPPPRGTLPGARPQLAAQVKLRYRDVCGSASGWMDAGQLPVVYHPRYNITFMGLEKLHPFDSAKFKKVLGALVRERLLSGPEQTVAPAEASLELLGDVHTQDYLHKIHHHNLKIVQVTELAPLFMLPNPLLRRAVISPMKYHVAGE